MPQRPRTPCNYPRCPRLVNPGERYCLEHKRQEQRRYDEQRGTAAQRGYTYRWNKYSRWFRRQNPLCAICEREGRVAPSEHVDHIKPVNGPDDPNFWEPGNHWALCHSCHSRKTAKEDGGFGR